MNIPEWTQKIHANAVAKGWWDEGERDPDELCMLIVTEIAEAVEALRSPQRDRLCDKCEESPGLQRPYDVSLHDYPPQCPKCHGTGKAIAGGRYREELADAAIRLLDLCGWYEIGVEVLGQLFSEKASRMRHLISATDWACDLAPALDAMGDGHRSEVIDHPEDVASDLLTQLWKAADCTLDEFEAAIAAKHAYNETRPRKHGKEF